MNPKHVSYKMKGRHGYSVKFSPFLSSRLAYVASQYYGIAGCGNLYFFDVFGNELRLITSFTWNNVLFDLTWAENNEHIVVTAGGDGSIHVWDVAQSKGPLKVFREHKKEVNSVDWSQVRNENFVISASWDKEIKLWDILKSESLCTFEGHEHIVYHAGWSPHLPSTFASASGDQSLRLWDARKAPISNLTIPAHDGEVLSCDWCKYNQYIIFSGGVDGSVKGWDIRNPRLSICDLRGHSYAVRRVRASPYVGSIVASASYDCSVQLWNWESQNLVEVIKHHTEFVYGLDFSLHEPGQMADCGWDELLHVYTNPACMPQA